MAWTSQGTTLNVGTPLLTSGAIGDIKSLSISGITRSELVRSGLADATKQYLGGVVDYGTIELQMNYTPTMGGLRPQSSELAAQAYYISMPTSASNTQNWEFTAWKQSMTVEATIDGALSGTLTLKLSGPMTVTNSLVVGPPEEA